MNLIFYFKWRPRIKIRFVKTPFAIKKKTKFRVFMLFSNLKLNMQKIKKFESSDNQNLRIFFGHFLHLTQTTIYFWIAYIDPSYFSFLITNVKT